MGATNTHPVECRVWGALFAAIVWNLAKLAFAYYAYQAWTLKDLYGSLVTIPLFYGSMLLGLSPFLVPG